MLDPISIRLLRNGGHHGAIALMYHSVTPGTGTPARRYAVSMRRFRAQLDLIQGQGWHTHRLDELGVKPLPARSVVITFDDGYQDNFAAFNELARRNMTASWFIVSRDIGRNAGWQDPGSLQLPMLEAAQLCEMHAAGMEIGSHSHTHCRLTECDDETLAAELARSKTTLEAMLNASVTSLAYPYGLHDDRVVEATRAAGYLAACTTRSGWAMRDGDPLRIRRLSVFEQDTVSAFARKLAFAHNDVSLSALFRYARNRAIKRIAGIGRSIP
ncbi:MAG: polysaccharide deacetylase family protein [Gallionellaceae bacterium]